MLLKFFKQTLPQVILITIILSILLWLKSCFSDLLHPFYFESITMPFYSIITNWISNNVILGRIITFIVMLFTGFYLLRINSKHIVIKQRTYLLSFFYIYIISSIIPLQQLNPAVFASFFIVFAIDHILSVYHKEVALDNLFRASFYIAIASLFYAPALFYFITILFSLLSIRTFNIREWSAALFGLITPWFFYFFYHYFVNDDLFAVINTLDLNLFTEVNNNSNILLFVFYSFCLLLFIFTGFYLVNTLGNQKISVRKFHGVFFWFNLVSTSIIVLIPTVSIEIMYVALIPMVFQYTHYFTTSNHRFWPNFLFILIFVISILMQLFSN